MLTVTGTLTLIVTGMVSVSPSKLEFTGTGTGLS
jgi:hypothetical protein